MLLVCGRELKAQDPSMLNQMGGKCRALFKWQTEHEVRQDGVCRQLLMLIIHLHGARAWL